MKKYINVLAWIILSGCLVAGFMIIMIFSLEIQDSDYDEAFGVLLLFILVYIIASYTWLTYNGRNNSEMLVPRYQKIILYGNITLFSIFLSSPLIFGYIHFQKVESAKKPLNLGEYEIFGDKSSLTIKYDNDLYYTFSVIFDKPERYIDKKYTINFYDVDGFKIDELIIEKHTNIKKSSLGDIIGIKAEDKIWKSVDDYSKIYSYTLSVN